MDLYVWPYTTPPLCFCCHSNSQPLSYEADTTSITPWTCQRYSQSSSATPSPPHPTPKSHQTTGQRCFFRETQGPENKETLSSVNYRHLEKDLWLFAWFSFASFSICSPHKCSVLSYISCNRTGLHDKKNNSGTTNKQTSTDQFPDDSWEI